MTSSRRFASAILILLFTLSFGKLAKADGESDPPGRAVDIRYISGQVSIQPGGVNDWVGAAINRPLTSADRVWTDKESRTELHLGTSVMRLNSETSMTLTNVSDQTVQVELDQGTLNLWVRRLYDGEIYEVDTPNMAFTITRAGDYRFDVDPNGDTTRVTVRRGEGEATGQGDGVRLHSDEVATFTNGTSMQHDISDMAPPDGFDDWCQVRDERAAHSASARYVSPDVIGSEDLDQYGTWRQTPDYGAVWVPAGVAPGWAPYHYGHWLWVEPWGWTWVDDAPWGFAPCHYGRWVYAGGYWGWTPGPMVVVARPVYAPALVGFVGGAHWGVGIGVAGGAGVGWFALGWNEPYVPPYAVSRGYFTNVNVTNIHVTNVTVINNYYNNTTVVNNIHYANRTAPGGFTAVPASAMASSQSVSKAALNVPPSEVAKAQVATAPPVAPSRNAVLGINAGAHAAAPPAQAVSRQVVTKTAPPPRPIPFEAKQAALAKNPGHPLDAQTKQQIRASLPPPPQNTNRPAAPNANNAPGRNPAPNANNAPGRNPAPNAPQPARNQANANPNAAAQNGGGRNVPRPPSAGGNAPRPGAANSPTNVPAGGNARPGTPANPSNNVNNANRSAPQPPARESSSNGSDTSRSEPNRTEPNRPATTGQSAPNSDRAVTPSRTPPPAHTESAPVARPPAPHQAVPKPPKKEEPPKKNNEEHKDKDKGH